MKLGANTPWKRYALSSETSVPEGIAFDPIERVFYVSSLQGGSITGIHADGAEQVFRPADDTVRLLGLKIDAERRRLWVCADPVGADNDHIWMFDLDAELETDIGTRALQWDVDLADNAAGAGCNDLVLDAQGIAYVTDPFLPNIYRIDADAQTTSILATDPLFVSAFGTAVGVGLNGIALSEDASKLYVARLVFPAILVVDLENNNAVSMLELSGDTLQSPDGLLVIGNYLYAVTADVVTGDAFFQRLEINDGAGTAIVSSVDYVSGTSTAVIAEGDIYVIKGEVGNFLFGAPLELPFQILRADLTVFP